MILLALICIFLALPPTLPFQITIPLTSSPTLRSNFQLYSTKRRNININEYDSSNDDFGHDYDDTVSNEKSREEPDTPPTEEEIMTEMQLRWIEQKKRENSNTPNENGDIQEFPNDQDSEASERLSGSVAIPKTGISVSDEMTDLQSKEAYYSSLLPLDDSGLALIETQSSKSIGDQPLRYLVPMDMDTANYALVDVPPFSNDLVQQIQSFLNRQNSKGSKDEPATLTTMLVTCRDGIHYNEAPAVYVTRTSDLKKWKAAFPSLQVVTYRLDTPRDVREGVDQILDGYGPWAWNSEKSTFEETGRPLTRMEWDEEVQAQVLDEGLPPPDEEEGNEEGMEDELYTPQSIRKREEGKSILAMYTPGHTYGSVTYIFPKTRVCCSGFTLPVEDTRSSANMEGSTAGPALDYRGYVTTNMGDWERQMESATELVQTYTSSFDTVLPSKGPPVQLENYNEQERMSILMGMIDEFSELGKTYSQLGII